MSFRVLFERNADAANTHTLNKALRRITEASNDGRYHLALHTAGLHRDAYMFLVRQLEGRGLEVIQSPLNHRLIVSFDSHRMTRWERLRSLLVRSTEFI